MGSLPTSGVLWEKTRHSTMTIEQVVSAATRARVGSLSKAHSTEDRDFILEAVKSDGLALKYASDGLKEDHEVVLEAVKSDGLALEYASDGLQQDREVVLEAVK